MRCLLPTVIRAISYHPCHPAHAYSTQCNEQDQPDFPYPSHLPNPTPHQIFHLPFGASQKEIKNFDLVRLHHPDSSHIRTSSPFLPPDLAHARFRAIKAAYDFLSGKTRSPHPNARPHQRSNPTSHFDPYLHELTRRRRAQYNASFGNAHAYNDNGSTHSDTTEDGWGPRKGWADGFGAPKDQQGEWNQDGWRERLVLSLGVMALLAGLFPSLPFTLASLLLPDPSYSHSSASGNVILSHSFIPDIYKNHREAVLALSQVRQETRQVGVERREGVRQRVREMTEHTATTEEHKCSENK